MDIDVEVIIEECIEIIKAKEVDKFDTAVLKIREHGAHAYELLCLALKHADEFESMYLTHAVISIGEDILPHILKILPELGGVSKSYVIAALGEIKSRAVIEPVKMAFEDPDSQVRQSVLQAIDKLNSTGEFDGEFEGILYKALNDGDIYIRGCAAGILGDVGGEVALDDLITMLTDAEPSVRAVAARGIGRHRGEKAVAALKSLLDDPMAFVVSAACLALAETGDETLIPEIARMLGHRSELVRLSAIKALGRMRRKQSIELLKPCLADENELVRTVAAQVIKFLTERVGV
jgi:HEAT repeat protein